MSILPRVSTIVLDTADITDGDINNHRTEFTFRNIDFDRVLGDEWREYDLFNLVLVSSVFDIHDNIPTTSVPEIRLTGPPFADVDVRANGIRNEVSVCTVNLTGIATTPNIVSYQGPHQWTLKRDDENLFNFKFRLVDSATNDTASGSFPRQMYVFKLYRVA